MKNIDCDSHIVPDNAFDEVAREYWQQRPQVVLDETGQSRMVYEARERNVPDYARHIRHIFSPRRRNPRINDPSVRIADMDKAQFDVQVLVPSNGLFYNDVEPKLAASVCHSHNNAISRIVRSHPGKFIGLTTVPLEDPRLAVQELQRSVRDLGLSGPVVPPTVKGNDLDEEELWPFYAEAEKLNVPIIVHPVNTGPMPGGWSLTRHYVTRGYAFWSALGHPTANSLALANLMFGGVLDAFPGLRFCFLEGGGTHVPHLLDGLSVIAEGEGDYSGLKQKPKRSPYEYLDRLYFSVRADETLLGPVVERLGLRSWVLGSDYPHADVTGSRATVGVIMGREDLSREAKEAILGKNAARLFEIPEALQESH
jgi:aminocarboxymuconate-semialdehyde decarboxylase